MKATTLVHIPFDEPENLPSTTNSKYIKQKEIDYKVSWNQGSQILIFQEKKQSLVSDNKE